MSDAPSPAWYVLGMSSEPDERTTSSAAAWAMWSVAAVLMYLLSPGIFVALVVRGGWEPSPALEKPFTIVFSPIALLTKWEPMADAYSSYLSWCAGQDIRRGP